MLEYPCIPRYSFGNQTSDSVCESSSENPSDAGNQQERLIKIGWITGFVDGEGCFSIHFVRQPHRSNRRGYRTGFQVAHAFAVTQGARRDDLLQTIIPFFQQHQLRTSKRNDFEKFVECMRLIQAKAHLTVEGLIAIARVTETMNHCKPRTEMIRILRDYTPDTDAQVSEDIVRSAWRHAG